MFLETTITCPECAGKHCSESRWKSRDEKRANPGKHPYRCVDCSHRFIAVQKKGLSERSLALGVGAVILAVAVAVVVLVVGHVVKPEDEAQLDIAPVETVAAVGPDTRQAALDGDVEAQFRMGKNLLFEASIDGRKAAEANKWLLMAAKNGHTGAMIQLGRMYRSGIGALQNYAYAAQWIQRAAESGDAEGMLELGRLYRDGVGLELNPERAYVWFNRAAAMHHADAARERDNIGRKLAPEQLSRAQQRSEEPPEEFADRGASDDAGENGPDGPADAP